MRYRIVRHIRTASGIRTDDVTLPGFGDALTMCGPNRDHVLRNAQQLGLYGVDALELDENDRIRHQEMN